MREIAILNRWYIMQRNIDIITPATLQECQIMSNSKEKTQNLKQGGSLHPDPKKVRDEKFSDNSFFDPEDLVQVKYEMIRSVKYEGISVLNASSKFGLSRPTYYHAEEQFNSNGLAGLIPQKRGPKHARKFTNDVTAYINSRLENPGKKPSWEELSKTVKIKFGKDVHPRSIERVIKDKKKLC